MAEFETLTNADVELLSAYIDNQLPSGERAALEARLAQEPSLRHILHELRVTVDVLRELEPVRPPRSFALDPAIVQPRRIWQLPATWMRLGSALAVLLLAITFTLDVSGRNTPNAAQAPMNERTSSGSTSATTMAAPVLRQPNAELSSAEAPTTDSNSAMSAAAAPEGAAATTANDASGASGAADASLPQSSGSSSPDTNGLGAYTSEKPQIVSSQPNSFLVIEFALGALALLLLAGSFWVVRRK